MAYSKPMSKHFPTWKRAEIRESKLSVRNTAKALGVNTSDVQRWKGRNSLENKPGQTKRRGGVSRFEDLLFQELLRLTRYSYPDLARYLNPIQPFLRRAIRQHEGISDDLTGFWSDRKYYAYLERELSGKLQETSTTKRAEPYSIASHTVRISWTDADGNTVKGKILFIIERRSGLLFAKAFKTRLNADSFVRTLSRMQQMLPRNMRKIHFVSSRSPASYETEPTSTALDLTCDADDNDSELNQASRKEITERIRGNKLKDVTFLMDPPSTYQHDRIMIPGKFAGSTELNRRIEKFVNVINLKHRSYPFRGNPVDVAPVDKMRERAIGVSAKDTARAIRQPLSSKYIWSFRKPTKTTPSVG